MFTIIYHMMAAVTHDLIISRFNYPSILLASLIHCLQLVQKFQNCKNVAGHLGWMPHTKAAATSSCCNHNHEGAAKARFSSPQSSWCSITPARVIPHSRIQQFDYSGTQASIELYKIWFVSCVQNMESEYDPCSYSPCFTLCILSALYIKQLIQLHFTITFLGALDEPDLSYNPDSLPSEGFLCSYTT